MLLWDYLQHRDDRSHAFALDEYLRPSEETDLVSASVLSEAEETEDEELSSEYVRVFIHDN